MVFRPSLRHVALLATFVVFVLIDLQLTTLALRAQPLGIDFMALWAGARMALDHPGEIYDFVAVTQAQQDLLGVGSKLRPFIYPPSAALVFAPFGLLDYWAAYAGFMLLSGALYIHAAWRLSGRLGALVLLAAAPVVVLCALTGQLSFLIGGLVASALVVRDRPVLCGVLLGVAAAIKPQLLLLFPLALALEGRWRVLAAAVTAGAALCLASLPLVGLSAWTDWLAALPRFGRLVTDDPSLMVNVMTPVGALHRWQVTGPLLVVAQAACVLAGAAVVGWTFTRKTSPALRLTALIGGALLITPYAMTYELAVIAPAVAALATDVDDDHWPYSLLALLLLSLLPPGLAALVGVLACVLLPWRFAKRA